MKIVITGYPASGKTTLAKVLAEQLKYEYLSVLDFARKHKLIEGHDVDRDCDIIDEDRLKTALSSYVREEDNVIIDGHLGHLINNHVVDLVIMTSCSAATVKKRMQQRGYDEQKIQENIDALNFFVIEDEIEQIHDEFVQIDTEQSLEESVQEALKIIRE